MHVLRNINIHERLLCDLITDDAFDHLLSFMFIQDLSLQWCRLTSKGTRVEAHITTNQIKANFQRVHPLPGVKLQLIILVI